MQNLRNEIESLKEQFKQLPPQPACFPRTPYIGVSIVDGLAAIGVNKTYAYRAQIAARNGIQGYSGTPQQNTHTLNLLKQGNLLIP